MWVFVSMSAFGVFFTLPCDHDRTAEEYDELPTVAALEAVAGRAGIVNEVFFDAYRR